MPRASDTIDDRTPLSAARIDVAARIGWLLRVHRTTAGLSLRQMSEALRGHGVNISAATLSRAESEGQRSPLLIEGYTKALGLPHGGLRADVDGVCRAFSYAPPSAPDPTPLTLDSFSTAWEAVNVPHPTAGAWLDFTRLHRVNGGFGLPLGLMEPLVQRLADEATRGVARSRLTRHEALNQLTLSPYAELTASILRRNVDNADHQNFYDLTSVLSDHPTPGTAGWAARMLSHESLFHVRGASYVLQGMLVHGGLALDAWRALLPLLEEAWNRAQGHPEKMSALQQLAAALPPTLRAALPGSGLPATVMQPPVAWSRARNNPHYALATSIARAACQRLGQPDEPLLERLLFEAFFEPRGVRMSTSTWTLMGSPFAAALVREITERQDWPDSASRSAALRVATVCHGGEDVPATGSLLETDDETEFGYGTTLVGLSGKALPSDALARGLAGDETTVRRTLHCLGMAGDPRLADLAQDESLPPRTRRGAAWWIEQGPRILV